MRNLLIHIYVYNSEHAVIVYTVISECAQPCRRFQTSPFRSVYTETYIYIYIYIYIQFKTLYCVSTAEASACFVSNPAPKTREEMLKCEIVRLY